MASRYLKVLQEEIAARMRDLANVAQTINANLYSVGTGKLSEADIAAALADALEASNKQISIIHKLQEMLL